MKKEILISILAIVTLAVTIWGYKFISGKNLFSGNYTYYAHYDDVQDVNTATSVQINGYEVGTVISIQPEPEDIKKIKLGFTVKKDIRIPNYTVAKLMSSSPLGGKVIELEFDKMCDGSNCAENGSMITGETLGLLGSMIKPGDLDTQIKSITDGIDNTLEQLGDPESDAAVDVSVRNLAITLENFAKISQKMESLMARSSGNMEKTLANMANMTESLVGSNEKLNSMLDNLTAVTEDIKNSNITKAIENASGTMEQAEASLKTVEGTMSEATATLSELKDVLKAVTEGDGSMAQLMNDKALYENLESTTNNLNLLLQDIRLNPRRYFKLFGKKVPAYEYPENDPAVKDQE